MSLSSLTHTTESLSISLKFLESHESTSPTSKAYKATLEQKVIHSRSDAPRPPQGWSSSLRNMCQSSQVRHLSGVRRISKAPIRSLDAPGAVDDYYSSLLAWGSGNVLAVALGGDVYLWRGGTGRVDQLSSLPREDVVTAVSWVQDGKFLAIGTSSAELQLWDVTKGRQVRSLAGHESKINALSWNRYLLTSGAQDSTMFDSDVRVSSHRVTNRTGHSQAITGLAWSMDGAVLASGGNDNSVQLWSAGRSTPNHVLHEHTASVKALAWAPFQKNLLATGGGNGDNTIKFWNTAGDPHVMSTITSDSQICSLQWSSTHREILSTHGFNSNAVRVWKYPSNVQLCDIRSHDSRVLHSAVSPDGRTVCTMGGERCYFWDVWPTPEKGEAGKPRAHTDRSFDRGLDMSGVR